MVDDDKWIVMLMRMMMNKFLKEKWSEKKNDVKWILSYFELEFQVLIRILGDYS